MKYVLHIPKYNRSNQKNLEKIVCQYNQILLLHVDGDEDEVAWEFCGVKTIDTICLVIVTALSRQFAALHISQTIVYDSNSKNVIDFMARMDFFKICNAEYCSDKARYQTNTFCELSSITTEDEVNIPIYALRKIMKSHSCPSALEVAITEIIMNAMHHAEAAMPCYVAARVFRGNIDIAICDTGMGIKAHLSKTFDDLTTDIDAIRLALEQYITGNRKGTRANSGMGLYISKNIFRENKGIFTIWSGEGLYQLNNGVEKSDCNKPNWQGTVVGMHFILKNGVDIAKIYKGTETEENSLLDSIFS